MEKQTLLNKVIDWCKDLTAEHGNEYTFTAGRKYIKIINKSIDGVFAFVDADGMIYKPASWNTPAYGVRATIDNAPLYTYELYK